MAEFKFPCPQCGQNIQCGTGYAGTQINCPTCQQAIIVPPAPPSAAPPAIPVTPQAATSSAIRRGIPALAAGQQFSGAPVRAKPRTLRIILVSAVAVVVLAGLVIGGWYGYSKLKIRKLPPDAVAFWSGNGTGNDSLGGNNGTLQNGVSFAPGKAGQAFSFSGKAYVEIPSSSAITPTGSFTVMAWVNYTRLSGNFSSAPVVAKGPDAPTAIDWFLGISPNRRLRPHINVDGNWVYYDCGTELAKDVWYHVAMVYDGTTLRGYVNGVLDGSRSVSGTLQTTDNPLRIGAYAPVNGGQGGSFCFQGRISQVALCNRALSASVIQAVYTEQK